MPAKGKLGHLNAIHRSRRAIAQAERAFGLDVRIAYDKRDELGLTVEEIAEAAGMSRQGIYKVLDRSAA